MTSKNYRQSVLLSMIILFFGFVLLRYALLNLHKMKDWPTVLFVFCFIVLVICFFVKKTITPLITSISYILGFLLAYILQTNSVDPGSGTTNNLWFIWTVVILVSILLSIIIELYISKK